MCELVNGEFEGNLELDQNRLLSGSEVMVEKEVFAEGR